MDHEGDGSGDGLLLDESQQRALQLFHARVNVALLGRAGCGKSVVMRRMIDAAIVRWGHAGVAVGALSASAALVVGGQTLHSIFGMDTRPLSRDAWVAQILKRPSVCERLNKLRVLFVDEVFTLPSSLFTRLAYIMRLIAPPHMQHLPFGGCQVVGAGDPLQVVPVKVTDTSLDRMVFDCASWRSTFDGAHGQAACLTGCHRQAGDNAFRALLDAVRWGQARDETIDTINATWLTSSAGTVTKLRIRKAAVQDINETMLGTIQADAWVFQAQDVFLTQDRATVSAATTELRSCAELVLYLKRGASVILTRKLGDFQQGTRGLVEGFERREMVVDARKHLIESVICNFDGQVVHVGRMRFSAYNGSGTEIAYCEQVPLILGWAVTVHRSQGLTLDAVEIDFSLDTWTTCGLVYTALSRARSLAALRVCGLRREHIRVSRCASAFFESKLQAGGVRADQDGRPGARH